MSDDYDDYDDYDEETYEYDDEIVRTLSTGREVAIEVSCSIVVGSYTPEHLTADPYYSTPAESGDAEIHDYSVDDVYSDGEPVYSELTQAEKDECNAFALDWAEDMRNNL